MKGKNALPYLIEKYGYNYFKETLARVNKQYNDMPTAFKDNFTFNEEGEIVMLKDSEEMKLGISKFWDDWHQKYK